MLAVLVWICAILPSLSLLYFSAEVLAGLRPLRNGTTNDRQSDLAILIPAHNEAAMIEGTLNALRHMVGSAARVVVIADNCSDKTAELARSGGAEVFERRDAVRRGKGFALAFARECLSVRPPDVVFVLDADCRVERGSVEAMCAYAAARGEPAQCANLLSAPRGASALVLLSNFAMLMKNLVRARGLYRLGGSVTLFGTGMAFPWPVFATLHLATSESVEDLSSALELAAAGTRVHLYEDLLVTSRSADLGDSLGQRKRWEHGFLGQALRHGLPFVMRGIAARSRRLAMLGAHLLVPPLALLFVLAGTMLLPAAALAVWAANPWPAACLLVAIGLALLATAVAWLVAGRSTLPLTALLQAPFYVAWKIPLYLAFVYARHTGWNRTRRGDEKT